MLLPPSNTTDESYVADIGGTEGGLSTYFLHPTAENAFPGTRELLRLNTSTAFVNSPLSVTVTVVQGATQMSAHFEIEGASYSADVLCTWTADNTAEAACTNSQPDTEVFTSTVSLSATTLEIGTTVGAPAASSGPSASSGASVTSVTPLPSGGSSPPVVPGSSNSAPSAPEQSEDAGSGTRSGVSASIIAATVASFWLL